MFTILPVYQEKMPESFIYASMEEAIAGAKTDFADPYSPETKGYMIVEVKDAIGVTRSLNEDTPIDEFILPTVTVEEDDFEMTTQDEDDAGYGPLPEDTKQ